MPETADDLVRAPRPPAKPRVRTPEERARRAANIREKRAAIKRAAAGAGFSFDAICAEVGLLPSPRSTLDPRVWHDFTSLWEGLTVSQVPRIGAPKPRGNNHKFFAV